MPLQAFAAATGLREVSEQGLPGPPRGPASPPGLEQDKGWEQLTRGRRSVSWDHKKGMLLGLGDTDFYCRVSTKASNSRTFFSCAASFSGSESCAGAGGDKSGLVRRPGSQLSAGAAGSSAGPGCGAAEQALASGGCGGDREPREPGWSHTRRDGKGPRPERDDTEKSNVKYLWHRLDCHWSMWV